MNRALLVIDVQNEYFEGGALPVTYPPESLSNILRAMDVAAREGIPVIVVRHSSRSQEASSFRQGTPAWELHHQVARRHRDHLVDKQLPGSFTGTDLEAWLRERHTEVLVICGYMTQMCCDTTARQAHDLGLGVEFLADATGTLSVAGPVGSVTAEELHLATLVTQQSVFSHVMTTAEWIASLGSR